jgi:adenosylhomocysteine nucleosidase
MAMIPRYGLFFICWGAWLALGCDGPQQPPPTDPKPTAHTVVMSAYAPELAALLDHTDVHETSTIDGTTFYVGTLAGNDVVLVLSGIGLIRAEHTTRALLDTFEVSEIVFSGIAGGINPNLSIGDVTVPTQWGQADGGVVPGDDDFWIAVDATMLRVAVEASRGIVLRDCTADSTCLGDPPQIVLGGNGISNSFFVNDAMYREWL